MMHIQLTHYITEALSLAQNDEGNIGATLYAVYNDQVQLPLLNETVDAIFGAKNHRKKFTLATTQHTLHTADFEGLIVINDAYLFSRVKDDKSNVYIKNTSGTELPFEIRYAKDGLLVIYVKLTTANREFYLYVDVDSYTRTTTIADVWTAYKWVFDIENGWANVTDVSGNIESGDIAKSGTPTYEVNKLGYPMPVLDGVDDYLHCANAPALYSEGVGDITPFTFIAGVRRDSTDTLDMILGQGSANSTRNLLHWGFREGSNYFLGYYGADLDYESSTNPGHYAVSSNGSKIFHTVTQTYENNKTLYNEISETALVTGHSAYYWNTTTTLYIGRFGHNDSHYFKGGLYDLRCRADEMTINNWKLTRNNMKYQNSFWQQEAWEEYT